MVVCLAEPTRLRSLHSLLLNSVRSCVLLLDNHGVITHANTLCQATFKYTQVSQLSHAYLQRE